MVSDGNRVGSTAALVVAAAIVTWLPIRSVAGAEVVHRVGAVTRHASRFVGQHVLFSGYVLAREPHYILFSDEPSGRISRFDLPVIGTGIEKMRRRKKYLIEGKFLDYGLAAKNGSRYHLELTAPPREDKR